MILLRKLLEIFGGGETDKLAGVLIDMQDYYLLGHTKSRREQIIESQLKVIDFLLERNYPVAVLEYTGEEKGPTIPVLKERLGNTLYEVFPKKDNDGFTNPDLLQKLREWEAKHLVVMGVNSSFCVRDTAASAKRNGFSVSTSYDLISDSQYFLHPEKWYKRNCVYYTKTTEDLLRKLAR